MDKIVLAVLLVPVVPLLAAFARFPYHVAGLVMSWVLFLSVLIGVGESEAQVLLLWQIPLLILMSLLSFRLSSSQKPPAASGETGEGETLDGVRKRHSDLKERILQQEREEAQSLQIYGTAKALAEALSWKDMAPRLTSSIQKVFGAYDFLLYAPDGGGGWTILHRRGNWNQVPPVDVHTISECRVIHPPQVSEIAPVAAVPIYSGEGSRAGRINGVLFMKLGETAPGEADLIRVGREFGEQLGVALNKALLFNQMEMQSRVDALTGTLRRQPFMDRLKEELKRASVFHTTFSVMMVDIDHFKSVNDSHGHEAGDAVLARVGQILRESVYETDVVGRYGGEEFVILMPRGEPAGVMRKAELLRQRFESEIIPCGFAALKITVSIGVSHYPRSGNSAEELIHRADIALYDAKGSGRNRVVAA